MFNQRQIEQATQALDQCVGLNLRLVTAESCTGGLIAACLTAIPGSSRAFDRGFITYDNLAKVQMLGVSEAMLTAHGAVSEAVARAMAEGALANAAAQIAVATTGVAGPGGGTETKPVGLVHIAVAGIGRNTVHARKLLDGDREHVRFAAMEEAISMLNQFLWEKAGGS
jgi:nicotinamide-nucleotide amidase